MISCLPSVGRDRDRQVVRETDEKWKSTRFAGTPHASPRRGKQRRPLWTSRIGIALFRHGQRRCGWFDGIPGGKRLLSCACVGLSMARQYGRCVRFVAKVSLYVCRRDCSGDVHALLIEVVINVWTHFFQYLLTHSMEFLSRKEACNTPSS